MSSNSEGGRKRVQGIAELRIIVSASNHLYHISHAQCTYTRMCQNVHNPLGPLAVRFGHFLDDESQNVSGLIEEARFNDVMSQYMCRHSPLFPMLYMCIYAPFVNSIELFGFVNHGCLSDPWTPLTWIIDNVAGIVLVGSLRYIVRRCFRSRLEGTVWGFRRMGALWDLGCGGFSR